MGDKITYGGAAHTPVCRSKRGHNSDRRSDPASRLYRIVPEVLPFCEVFESDVCNTRLWISLQSDSAREKESLINDAR